MKVTGIVRKVDNAGRVVLPKDICRAYDIKGGSKIKLYIADGDRIVLEKLTDDKTEKMK